MLFRTLLRARTVRLSVVQRDVQRFKLSTTCHKTVLGAIPFEHNSGPQAIIFKHNFSTSAPGASIFSSLWGGQSSEVPVPVEKVHTFGAEGTAGFSDDTTIRTESSFALDAEVPAEVADPELGSTLVDVAEAAPSFADLGLGGSILPHRLFQDVLEYLHNTVGLDWFPAIAVLAVVVRTLAIPLYIKIRAFSAHTSNHFPETYRLQQEMMRQKFANPVLAKKANIEYMEYMKKHKINPLGALMYQLPNGIVFMSMFMALRGMCKAPVPSMTTGGILWFPDLTIADPYMVLPVLSCLSMSAIIKFGAADAEMGPTAQMSGVRKLLMWMPIVSIPFLVYQPSAMFAFWIVSNIFSVFLTTAFRNKALKKFCGIPEMVAHDKAVMDRMSAMMNPKKVVEEMRKKRVEAEQARKLMDKLNEHKKMVEKMQKQNRK